MTSNNISCIVAYLRNYPRFRFRFSSWFRHSINISPVSWCATRFSTFFVVDKTTSTIKRSDGNQWTSFKRSLPRGWARIVDFSTRSLCLPPQNESIAFHQTVSPMQVQKAEMLDIKFEFSPVYWVDNFTLVPTTTTTTTTTTTKLKISISFFCILSWSKSELRELGT